MSRICGNMEGCKVGVYVCIWPNICSMAMLNFMLYYSCE